jgi:hypothetical protein
LNPTQNERKKERKNGWSKKCNYLLPYLLTYWLTNWQLWEIAELLIFREVLTALLQKETKLQQPPTGNTIPSWTVCVLSFFLSFFLMNHTSHTPRLQITLGPLASQNPDRRQHQKLQCQRPTTSACGGIVGS